MAGSEDPSKRTRLYRERTPGERWLFALLLIPASLTALVVVLHGSSIESELENQTVATLREAGLAGTTVQVSGRNATLLVPTGESQDDALAVAQSVDGLADVSVQGVARDEREARACKDLQNKIDNVTQNKGVLFSGGRPALSPEGATAIRGIAKLLVKCPSATVVAEGYTDPSVVGGSTVSLRRAQTVRDALVAAGVGLERVEAEGFGDSFPAADNGTASGRALNNRVVVTVSGG